MEGVGQEIILTNFQIIICHFQWVMADFTILVFFLFLAKLIIGEFWKKSGLFFPIEETFVEFLHIFWCIIRDAKIVKIFARNFVHV